MDRISLVEVSQAYAAQIEDYIAEFPAERMRVTLNPDSIPGADGCEEYGSVAEWLSFCAGMAGKITWYMSVRETDGRIVGMACFRHDLAYDDDDPEFASHIGYSVRPSERRKGYAAEQLRLVLEKAGEAGLKTVRLVCRDINEASGRTIRRCGGILIDTIRGEESGLNVCRYDIRIG